MPKHEHIHDKEDMVKFTKDYLVDEIHRLQRKCQRYEQRLEYIWNDDTILNLQKRIWELERKELKAKLQIINKDSPIINLLKANKQKGISYRTVAKKLKIDKSTLSRWVNGREKIPSKRERQIYKLFQQSSV
jgi:plasmid maintenance system antidote protein VapI